MEWRTDIGLRDDCTKHVTSRTWESVMGIHVNKIHNLIRTYQRALHAESRSHTAPTPAADPDDRVLLSVEARERHQQDVTAAEPTARGKSTKT